MRCSEMYISTNYDEMCSQTTVSGALEGPGLRRTEFA